MSKVSLEEEPYVALYEVDKYSVSKGFVNNRLIEDRLSREISRNVENDCLTCDHCWVTENKEERHDKCSTVFARKLHCAIAKEGKGCVRTSDRHFLNRKYPIFASGAEVMRMSNKKHATWDERATSSVEEALTLEYEGGASEVIRGKEDVEKVLRVLSGRPKVRIPEVPIFFDKTPATLKKTFEEEYEDVEWAGTF